MRWFLSAVFGAISLVLATLGAGGCDSKCKDFAAKAKQRCIKQATQTIYIDGKPSGTLQSEAEAEAACTKASESNVGFCKDAPDEVFRCAELNYAGSHDEWSKDGKCQRLLTDYYEKTHPNERH